MPAAAARVPMSNVRLIIGFAVAIALFGVLALAWQQGLFGDPARTPGGQAARQRELAVLPGKPGSEPIVQPSLDPLTALNQNAAVPFVKGPITPARAFNFTGSAADRLQATECLALTAMAEAGGSDPGQRAVIQVVLNRVRHPAFPKTICGVVFQGSERATGCQFTYTCDGSLARRYPDVAWQAARKRAREALDGYVYKPVGLATHYHTNWVYPYWSPSLDKVAQVDTHLFFRWRGFWGTPAAVQSRYRGGEPSFTALVQQVQVPDPLASESAMDAASEAADVAKVGSLAAGKTAGELVIPHPDGGAFLVGLKPGTGASGAVAMARRLCGGNGYCRVMAWADRSAVPRGYPVPPQARNRISMSYVLDDQNRETIEFDCALFKGTPAGQCRGGPEALPVDKK
ncbi:cell wall hydrolase [Novosphingobium ginsenosidimutans]|nr:cell wall hydrolase [Novosphingobium ginsenosidimutans]